MNYCMSILYIIFHYRVLAVISCKFCTIEAKVKAKAAQKRPPKIARKGIWAVNLAKSKSAAGSPCLPRPTFMIPI